MVTVTSEPTAATV